MSPNLKTTPTRVLYLCLAMTREELEKKIDELARKYVEKRDPKIIEQRCDLRTELKRLEGKELLD